MGRAVGTHPGFGGEINGSGNGGAHHTRFRRGHTPRVEGAHRQLRAGLTDGLGGDDADGFAEVDQFVVGQCPAVALAAHRAVGLAGERGTDADGGDAGLLER